MSDTEIKMDIALRETTRVYLLKLIDSATGIMAKEVMDEEAVEEIEVVIEKIEAVQVNLSQLNSKIASKVKTDQMQAECDKIIEFNDQAIDTVARLKRTLRRTSDAPIRKVPGALEEDTKTNECITVRLPRLEINKFDGDIAAWPEFWEQFEASVHNNVGLSKSAKFSYLKSYLTGRALITITGLTTGRASYEDAIDLLKNEYGNSEKIIDTYIEELLAIAPVKGERDTQGLRKLFTAASTITKSLATLGVSPEQYGLLVKSILLKALPYRMRVLYNKERINKGVSSNTEDIKSEDSIKIADYGDQISGLLYFIKVELDSLEQAGSTSKIVDSERSKEIVIYVSRA